MNGVVIYHPELGIYLGSCMGMGFWSKLDPAGQDAAVVIESQDIARTAMADWDEPVEGCTFVPVEADRPGQRFGLPGYATVAACVRAGLPAWNPDAPGNADIMC